MEVTVRQQAPMLVEQGAEEQTAAVKPGLRRPAVEVTVHRQDPMPEEQDPQEQTAVV